MTPTKYYVFRIAQIFGYNRKNIRMGAAATETHLLKEAESHLGRAIWKNVENIEGVSVEYWNLRKLENRHELLAEKLIQCRDELTKAHEERASLLEISNEPFMDLIEKRKEILREMEGFARERDAVVARAREIRRAYDGFKTKQEVLTKEGNHAPEEFEKITQRLASLKTEFSALKRERHDIAEKISVGDAKIDDIDAEVLERKKERRSKASEAFQQIGDANQEMSTLRSEMGSLNTQIGLLYSEIGRYVSLNASSDPSCMKACEKYRGLVDVMGALRKSILYNHKLADEA
ncbi:MAG: hypothetical protein NWT08_10275 [Akkermansiaceae bacterium]|jgi:chromosome segregation ATPase|nr:hypothetical protein [Akkermansiaceae bacterium]MDP4647566.1 hypothetical protein [Akkermansiaceae bacterium]MDP4720725.1 hypothetical protein [Akkermansiaceae bacterium]MDP4779128.1 hypothetical protein [Akkermansiaceae bacterium]MDP4847247.1 hypothetical protein [Akkermansiaceae bacterium]